MATSDGAILEGFWCPLCMSDLKSFARLTNHFETFHEEDQDLLKALKGMFGKAKKIITNELELREPSERQDKLDQFYYNLEEQEVGVSQSFTEYFKGVRSSRLERYAAETNKLLIRLDKLVSKMPSDPNQRRQHEQDVVPWLDESLVSLCPNCAKTFNLTRRKHHCRLCGSILCHDCSVFVDIKLAKSIVDPSAPQVTTHEQDPNTGLRLCEHCFKLIELRKQVQESRNSKSNLALAYEQMRKSMEQATPAVAMYEKMCASLLDGETVYTVSDVNALRGRIGKLAETIDVLSKRVAALPAEPGSRQARLQAAVRQAAAHYIKEELLSLSKQPTEAQIEAIRQKRYERAVQNINEERYNLPEDSFEEEPGGAGSTSLDGVEHNENDLLPLLEQMNIIRGYLKQAREDCKFDEVAILEKNLNELKKEYRFKKIPLKNQSV